MKKGDNQSGNSTIWRGCRQCSNMARAGMNPKTLQYLMGHSDIGVTMNTYTHLGLEDAQNEMVRLEELNRAKEEVAKAAGEKKPVTQRSFRAVYYGSERTNAPLIVMVSGALFVVIQKND